MSHNVIRTLVTGNSIRGTYVSPVDGTLYEIKEDEVRVLNKSRRSDRLHTLLRVDEISEGKKFKGYEISYTVKDDIRNAFISRLSGLVVKVSY